MSKAHEIGSPPGEVVPAKGKASSAGGTARLCCWLWTVAAAWALHLNCVHMVHGSRTGLGQPSLAGCAGHMLEGEMGSQTETLGLFLWKRRGRGLKYPCFFRGVLSVLYPFFQPKCLVEH